MHVLDSARRIGRFVSTFSVALTLLSAAPAWAKLPWLEAVVARYPTSPRLFTCGTCHTNFSGPGAPASTTPGGVASDRDGDSDGDSEQLNPYGRAFESAGGEGNADRALARIERSDSDGDGTSNLDEILTAFGFMPGYTCGTYAATLNAPQNLAQYVDPTDIGCGIATTTTLSPVTTTVTNAPTTTTSTTSTTLPGDTCGQPVSQGTHGSTPRVTDCLFILRAALGLVTCTPECSCAPKGSLPIASTDALVCLRNAVGQDTPMTCPCGGSSTTTLPRPTTTMPSTSTTTTTTTTTMPSGGSVTAGRTLYENRCTGCHKATPYDANGFASDLRGDGGLLRNDLGTIDSLMRGLTLTDREIADLAAFLNSL